MGQDRKAGQALMRAMIGMVLIKALLASPAKGADLPPEIQVDRLLVQADRESREGVCQRKLA